MSMRNEILAYVFQRFVYAWVNQVGRRCMEGRPSVQRRPTV